MISRIELVNFRRHAETSLEFTPDEQLIVVSGDNGAGKSTLVSEALLFAFYGESRHGRRRLDDLVRRGAELEGVRVTVTFTVAGREWKVSRQRVEKITTATLSVDGDIYAEGAQSVDAEIAALLGMDSAGFRLAVLARQKELDGLTSLDRTTRRKVLGRLLRIDAVGRASKKANDAYLRAAEILAAFPTVDLDTLRETVTLAEEAASDAAARRDSAAAEVDRLEKLAATSATDDARAVEAEARWREKVAAANEAARVASDAAAAAAAARTAANEAKYPPAPVVDLDTLAERRAVLVGELANADMARRAAADHDVLSADLADLDKTIFEISERISAGDGLAQEREQIYKAGRECRKELSAAMSADDTAREAVAVASTRRSDMAAKLEQMREVGVGTCDRCGTELDEEHLASHIAELTDALDAATSELDAATDGARETSDALAEVQSRFDELTAAARNADEAVAAHERDIAERAELRRRRAVLAKRVSTPPPPVPDTDALTDELAELDRTVAAARDVLAVRADTEALRRDADAAERAARQAAEHADSLAADAAAMEPSQQMRAARDVHAATTRDLVAAREHLADTREHLAAATAAATEAQRAVDVAVVAAQRRGEREHTAHIAAHTKAVLRACHEQLSAGLRPQLEAAATQLLAQLSEGRFPAVQVSPDYDITVSDDGAFRHLGDLSGGEIDLVALALRLALAQVVADRRGADALGLLVLDEVFGSQDASRRQSILAALRELRSIYGQIFLISHVGGLEDVADRVVDVELDDDRVAEVHNS